MKKILSNMLMLIAIPIAVGAVSISSDDFRFILDREQYHLITKYETEFMQLIQSQDIDDRRIVLEYAQRMSLFDLAAEVHFNIAKDFGSLEDALQWLILEDSSQTDSLDFVIRSNILSRCFSNDTDSLVFRHYLSSSSDGEISKMVQSFPTYNDVIESSAKSVIDEISTISDSKKAIELIGNFYQSFPNSKWSQAAFYYQLYHLSILKDFDGLLNQIFLQYKKSPSHAYISSLYLLSPSFRKELSPIYSNDDLIFIAASVLESANSSCSHTVLFDYYSNSQWHSRIQLQQIKQQYYSQISSIGLFGDEEHLTGLYKKPRKEQKEILRVADSITFLNNDRGEFAELHFWKGRLNSLFRTKRYQIKAIDNYGKCLVWGAPRKRYDADASKALSNILNNMKITTPILEYLRNHFRYKGLIFDDTQNLEGKRYSRVALADYDNDGLIDILFNGNRLYRNLGKFQFEDVSDQANVSNLDSNGGLWADFNKDGILDFVTISNNSEGRGEALMKGMDGKRFVKVNERAGEVDNGIPTEGAAWIDIDGHGFPSLYLSNYEKWQERSGYPDNFFYNSDGYFLNQTTDRGFLLQDYANNPGLAGRGVAPADFDNDGKQEVFVTNYRLDRNFLFKQSDDLFIDVAALYGLAGKNKNDYYGHSIGADWADYDNDGDLDLFIANLAHPRYLDISDISMLLRNDGLSYKIIGADTLFFWQFTDVTKESGITYDELHSDPLFFDADNDGFMDLFITSVYENDRSYLYHNNGDGTFTDVSYLSGARVFNGWGNAAGDFDRDGLIDLAVCSGNGTKLLRNRTCTKNKAIYIKPIHDNDNVQLLKVSAQNSEYPNSPAFGIRVKMILVDKDGREYSLIRELSSAKGTTSQNAPELHFGIAENELIRFVRWHPEVTDTSDDN